MKPDPLPDKRLIEERIRERAHQLWIEEGRPEGRDQDHWEKARALLEREAPGNESAQAPAGTTFTDSLTTTVDPLHKTKTAAKKKRTFKSTKA